MILKRETIADDVREYRFRKSSNLFGKFEELENQNVFLASTDDLNNPMEDVRDIVWNGDKITWTNLFEHYLYCIGRVMLLSPFVANKCKLEKRCIPINEHRSNATSSERLTLLDEIEKRTFDSSHFAVLVDKLSMEDRAISRNELLYYLKILHFHALPIIQNIYVNRGLWSDASEVPTRDGPTYTDLLLDDLSLGFESGERHKIEEVFASKQNNLRNRIIAEDLGDDPHVAGVTGFNRRFVMIDFPSNYVKMLDRLLDPEVYVACFTRRWDSELMWAHYADGHKGVSLIFDTLEKDCKEGLSLYQPTSYRSSKTLGQANSLIVNVGVGVLCILTMSTMIRAENQLNFSVTSID